MACSKALSVVACSFEFTNVADEDLYILKYDTPLEGLFSPFVAVYQEGHLVQYEGLIGYRLSPRKQDFQLLKAGQSISATVQISDAFTFSSDGLYSIYYAKPLKFIMQDQLNLQAGIGKIHEAKVSEFVFIYLEDTRSLIRPAKPEAAKPDETVYIASCSSASYIGGTKSQKDDTTEAHKLLCNKLQKAKDDVGNNSLTIEWFGAYNSHRADTVESVYLNTKNYLTRNVVTYDFTNGLVTCAAKNWMAYTSHGSKTVYLCGPHGYDGATKLCSTTEISKEDTLVHEWTHASVGTKDYKYGTDKCKQLAKDDPAKAIDNADNYAFHYCRVK